MQKLNQLRKFLQLKKIQSLKKEVKKNIRNGKTSNAHELVDLII